MTTISYAQNAEDIVLDRVFARGRRGFYIDVGANGPVVDSITKHFYDLGWHGINIEPSAQPFQELAAARTRDVNLNVGLSDVAGEGTFYAFEESTISTFSPQSAARLHELGKTSTTLTVPTMTLAEVCAAHVTGTIDFLSVDVEGHEYQVLSGADWKRWRPRVVVVEATEPTTPIPAHERWEQILLDAEYLFATFDGVNRFYVRAEDADLVPSLAIPANPNDDYMPYRYFRMLTDLKANEEQATRSGAATRAVNASLLWELSGTAQQLGQLRSQYERLDRALTSARAQAEAVRLQTEAARVAAEHLPQDPASEVDGAGAAAIGIARRLTALSSQHPKAASSAKKALRLGLRAKRAVSGSSR